LNRKKAGKEKMLEIFVHAVIQLINLGIIKGEKVSLDCSIIWAWFKDCRWNNNPRHDKKECRRNRSRDRDASWTWDNHRERYVYGYKVHVVIDSNSGLPVMLTITKAGYGENKTVSWFIKMVLFNLPLIKISKFLADAGYDADKTRLQIVKRLKAVPFIPLNTRRCKGSTLEEKKARRKVLCYRFYARNFIKNYWVDPHSEEFEKEFDARTLSEQGFSIGKGSLNLDSLKHRGIEWATLHSMCICMVMLLVAKTAVEIGRPDLTRCIKCFQG
jgi:IS5 family transposase